jgi:hypothetical protein
VLAALITYQQGHGMRGSGQWVVVSEVVNALKRAFGLAFELPFGYDAVLSLALSADFILDHSGRVYAGTENHGLWMSLDGGVTWIRFAEAKVSGPVNALLPWKNGPAVQTESGLFVADQHGGWHNILPDPDEEREVITILGLSDLAPGSETLVSFTDGSVEVVQLS